jgi:hypothetical protein
MRTINSQLQVEFKRKLVEAWGFSSLRCDTSHAYHPGTNFLKPPSGAFPPVCDPSRREHGAVPRFYIFFGLTPGLR